MTMLIDDEIISLFIQNSYLLISNEHTSSVPQQWASQQICGVTQGEITANPTLEYSLNTVLG